MSATTVAEISKFDYIFYNSCHKLQHTGLQFSVCVYTIYDSQGQFLYYSLQNACLWCFAFHTVSGLPYCTCYIDVHGIHIVFKVLFVPTSRGFKISLQSNHS